MKKIIFTVFFLTAGFLFLFAPPSKADAADFVATSATVIPSGPNITIYANWNNIAITGGPAQNFYVYYYVDGVYRISRFIEYNAGVPFSDFARVDIAGPGGGQHTAMIYVDGTNHVFETNEMNNSASTTFGTPDCNTGISCGACSAPANTCSVNNGSQSCTYTTYSGGGACNPVAAPKSALYGKQLFCRLFLLRRHLHTSSL